MKLTKMQPWHLMAVAVALREADRQQFTSYFSGMDADPQYWACRTALRLGVAFAIITNIGSPVACIGSTCEDGKSGELWFAGTDEWTKSVRAQILGARIVRSIVREGGYAIVRTQCLSSNPYASRTLEKLGFTQSAHWPKMGGDGSDVLFYEWKETQCSDLRPSFT